MPPAGTRAEQCLRHQSSKYLNTKLPFHSCNHPSAIVEAVVSTPYSAVVQSNSATGYLRAGGRRTREESSEEHQLRRA